MTDWTIVNRGMCHERSLWLTSVMLTVLLPPIPQVDGAKTAEKQEAHTEESAKLIELHLKGTLTGLAHYLFGKEIEIR